MQCGPKSTFSTSLTVIYTAILWSETLKWENKLFCMMTTLPQPIPFYILITRYVCVVVCKNFCNLVRGGDYASSFFYWWYSSWFVVPIYLPKLLPYFLGWGSGIQWIYKFVPGIFSSFPENSLFDGSPTLEGSKFIYLLGLVDVSCF